LEEVAEELGLINREEQVAGDGRKSSSWWERLLPKGKNGETDVIVK
jgi:hypothetical protein